jgi:hypothetical protein
MSAPIPAVLRRLVVDQKDRGEPRCPERGLVVGIVMVDLVGQGQAKKRPYKVPSLLATLN